MVQPFPNKRSKILDSSGRPFSRTAPPRIRAKYDAAQTHLGNEEHWVYSDNLDPHSAASLRVRKVLRSRSRYEVIENNPYLKGTLLTIANDMVGSGPKIQITDNRIPKRIQNQIEDRWNASWSRKVRLRQKLWRMRLAKIADGESFMRSYFQENLPDPVKLNFQVLEADLVSSEDFTAGATFKVPEGLNEIDGVRFDGFDNPVEYHILNIHPGHTTILRSMMPNFGGTWVDARFVAHWYRQDRGWQRGIPELTPSLPLCAVLRRYTLAVLKQREFNASGTAFMKSELPPATSAWNSPGDLLNDPGWDTFPIEIGFLTMLPSGMDTPFQLQSVPDGTQYSEYVGALLRQITRPILVTHNITEGTSKDSNMASAVVDTHIYQRGQEIERMSCEEDVLDPVVLKLWWQQGILTPGYFTRDLEPPPFLQEWPDLRINPPRHSWRWDPVGIKHTDPKKVADALVSLRNEGILLDRDIQETGAAGNPVRSLEEWQASLEEEMAYRERVGIGQKFQPVDDENQGSQEEETSTEDQED